MTSLAVKYRPRKIADLIGQEHIVRILKGAFDSGKVGQAYVLTGIRGVGKTTTARIIARALQCAKGPTLEPCGACASCLAIDRDASLDLSEIDAASHNGVDAIRDMIANAAYAPVASRKRIFILDEAHMLTGPAWNSLLKTLEEPPAHVVFIFATTELRKIPATVLSRCQILRLGRIAPAAIAGRLDAVAAEEGVSLEPAASQMISRAGSGSMRDALSILDQATANAGSDAVTLDAVLGMLGRSGDEAMMIALGKTLFGAPADAIALWRKAWGDGADAGAALDGFVEHLHAAMLASMKIDSNDETLSPRMRAMIATIAERLDTARLGALEDLALRCRLDAGAADDKDRQVEMTLMKLSILAGS